MGSYAGQDRLTEVQERVVQHLMNDEVTGRVTHELALEITGMNQAQFELMSETDDENPWLQLYYATASSLLSKVLMRAADQMTYYKDLERTPFYKVVEHVHEIFRTTNLGDNYTVTYNKGTGARRVVSNVRLTKIDGPRNSLTFLYEMGIHKGVSFEVHCSQIVTAINNGPFTFNTLEEN